MRRKAMTPIPPTRTSKTSSTRSKIATGPPRSSVRVDRYRLVLGLDANHQRLRQGACRIAAKVRHARLVVQHFAGLHDCVADSLDLKRLLALHHVHQLVAARVHVKRQLVARRPVASKDEDL